MGADLDALAGEIKKARDELASRRKKRLADFDRRLAALDEIADAVAGGAVQPEAVRSRLRRLMVADRGAGSQTTARNTGGTRGKVTTIGTTGQVEATPLIPMATADSGMGAVGIGRPPSSERCAAMMRKTRGAVDELLVERLLGSRGADPLDGPVVSLLVSWRRALSRHQSDVPDDGLLREEIVEFASEVEDGLEVVGEQGDGFFASLARHLAEKRMLLVAGGAGIGVAKPALQDLRAAIRDGAQHAVLVEKTTTLFRELGRADGDLDGGERLCRLALFGVGGCVTD